ncbi:MAG TPA: hypothetical protein DCE42_02350 [Myxococcales bacterium]|nr:hypothetical protein [Myxococcales bacterium]
MSSSPATSIFFLPSFEIHCCKVMIKIPLAWNNFDLIIIKRAQSVKRKLYSHQNLLRHGMMSSTLALYLYNEGSELVKVGEKIRILRKAKGWTLKDLERETGLSFSFLSQVERGDSSFSQESIDKIATSLGVSSALLQSEEISVEHLESLSQLLPVAAFLPVEKLEVLVQMARALKD